MPGTKGGTGYRLWLRCWSCSRASHQLNVPAGNGFALEATGRTKPLRSHHRGIRSTDRQIEIRCRGCGHVGWSKHIDAELLLRQKEKKDAARARNHRRR